MAQIELMIMGDIPQIDYVRSNDVPEILAVEHLAALIHKSPASIRSDASRNPDALPPICRLPGNKRLLFRLEDVRSWLASHVQRTEQPTAAVVVVKNGRGRPRKVAL